MGRGSTQQTEKSHTAHEQTKLRIVSESSCRVALLRIVSERSCRVALLCLSCVPALPVCWKDVQYHLFPADLFPEHHSQLSRFLYLTNVSSLQLHNLLNSKNAPMKKTFAKLLFDSLFLKTNAGKLWFRKIKQLSQNVMIPICILLIFWRLRLSATKQTETIFNMIYRASTVKGMYYRRHSYNK